jgi:hypothetical protein
MEAVLTDFKIQFSTHLQGLYTKTSEPVFQDKVLWNVRRVMLR